MATPSTSPQTGVVDYVDYWKEVRRTVAGLDVVIQGYEQSLFTYSAILISSAFGLFELGREVGGTTDPTLGFAVLVGVGLGGVTLVSLSATRIDTTLKLLASAVGVGAAIEKLYVVLPSVEGLTTAIDRAASADDQKRRFKLIVAGIAAVFVGVVLVGILGYFGRL